MIVSMLPRFSCEPVVSVLVANTVFGNDPEAVVLTMAVDNVVTPYPPLVDAASEGSFDFSLLGSRKTIKDMEALCLKHVPIPYSN